MGYQLTKLLAVICLGLFLTILFTWPYLLNLNSFYQDQGDYPLMASIFFYNQEAFKSGLIFDFQKYFNGYQFYPQPNTIAYADTLIIPSIVYSSTFWISQNHILSVNLTLFLSFVISFTASFYLIQTLVKNIIAIIFGSVVLAFNPITFAHFPNHYYEYNALPLVFLFAIKLLTQPKFIWALWFGIILLINNLIAIYYQIFTIIFLPILAMPFLIYNFFQKNFNYIVKLVKSSLILIIFFITLLNLNQPYLIQANKEMAVRGLPETYFLSARGIDWFSPLPENLIYGNFVKSLEDMRAPGKDFFGFNYFEHTLFLNIIPMSLSILGLIFIFRKGWRITKKPLKLLAVGFGLILILAMLLTFGPYFSGWNSNDQNLALPFYFLYDHFFLLKGIRSPTRFQFVFYLPFAILVSLGVLYLEKIIKSKKLQYFILAILFLLLVLENINLKNFSERSENVGLLADTNFQNNIAFLQGKKVLHLPIHIPELGEWSFYTLNWNVISRSISLNGVSGYAPPDQLNFLMKLKNRVGEEELKQLSILGVDYLIIHQNLLGPEVEKYQPNFELFNQGKIYEGKDLLIIDLKKYNFSYNLCDFDKDIQKNLVKAQAQGINGQFYALLLKNKSDCYLPSIYLDKYKSLNFQTGFLGTLQQEANFHLPVIINPAEEIVLSEPAKNLRIR